MVVRSVIQKFDGDDLITKEFTSTSDNRPCGSSDGIENAINHFVSSTDKNLAKMHSMPSGYRLLEVTSLTLITTFIPDIRGGCGEYLSSLHKKSERRGLAVIKSKHLDPEKASNTCFKDAVLYQIMAKEIMKEIIEKHQIDCKEYKHDVACECYIKSEKEFLKLTSSQEYWEQFYDDDRVCWEGIQFPAGLEDLSRFAEQNPKLHVRAHLIYGTSAQVAFVGDRRKEQEHFIDLCFSEFHSFDTHEVCGHWYPVQNIAEFTSQILRKKENSNHVHKRYGEDACEKCLLHHHLPSDSVPPGLIDAKDKMRGLIKYRNKNCPYEIPENMYFTAKHREHLKLCGVENDFMYRAEESPTMIMTPKSKYFLYSNYRQQVDDRFSAFFDLETFNRPLEPVCLDCEELIETSTSQTFRDEIYTKCLQEHYFRQNSFKCKACVSQFKTALVNRQCECRSEHQKVLGNCVQCFLDEEEKFSTCNHITTQNIKKLETSGYSFFLHDNYKKEIVRRRVYFQKTEKETEPLKDFMSYLRNDIADYVQEELEKEAAPMLISEEEEREYQGAQFCYVCHKKSLDLVKDHCHVLGTYRGK